MGERPGLIVAALLGLMAAGEVIVRTAGSGDSVQRGLVLCLLALATTLPVGFAAEAAAVITTTTASVVCLALFHLLPGAALPAQLLVLHQLAYAGQPAARSQAIAVALSGVFLPVSLSGVVPSGSEAAALAVVLAALAPAAALAGAMRRARDAARLHAAVSEAVAGDLLQHAARGERARIARELHDVVAHHISLIAVQAETARMATPDLPAAGARRLVAIGDTARAALTEMRRLLGVLREDAQVEAPDLRPQPGLAQLNALLDAARDASGSAARLILAGRPTALDPGVQLAVYRIVQEALTNARRHAPGAGVDVELRFGERELVVRIRDNGPGPTDGSPLGGLGITGMRERAAAVGGQLHTGPAPGGGFLVGATLPAGATRTAD